LIFIQFTLFDLSCDFNLIFDFICLKLSLAVTHGIAKYARTYTRKHTHAHAQKKSTKSSKQEKGGKIGAWGQGRKKEKKEKDNKTTSKEREKG